MTPFDSPAANDRSSPRPCVTSAIVATSLVIEAVSLPRPSALRASFTLASTKSAGSLRWSIVKRVCGVSATALGAGVGAASPSRRTLAVALAPEASRTV